MNRAALRRRAVRVALGLLADRLFGEPPARVHPVVGFGALMHGAEEHLYRDAKLAGVAYGTLGVAVAAALGVAVPDVTTAVALTSAGRELRRTAAGVRDELTAGRLDASRARVRGLVGRDTAALDASGVAAAVIESVAENTVDAIVGPVLWAIVAGAPGAATYRAVNTMDALVGHRSARYAHFGWAGARADDVMNLVPARLTLALVLACRPRRAPTIVRTVARDAAAHPSPNAGVAEAAFAGALGLELGGPVCYGDRRELRPTLGRGPRPCVADIDRAIALCAHVELALLVTLLAVAGVAR
ncbi:MAG TPA: adenosylcobinamide-phosphate synthase CbiB [Acidimicrobiia bacterium]|nr:adenosylcobinamide-phosphate synthase CbiB [Acidimicrobiia bacterium]